MTFEQWTRDVDALCVTHLCCTWADLAGDPEPLERSFASGETPEQFVQWWAEKYGLTWVEEGEECWRRAVTLWSALTSGSSSSYLRIEEEVLGHRLS